MTNTTHREATLQAGWRLARQLVEADHDDKSGLSALRAVTQFIEAVDGKRTTYEHVRAAPLPDANAADAAQTPATAPDPAVGPVVSLDTHHLPSAPGLGPPLPPHAADYGAIRGTMNSADLSVETPPPLARG